MDQHNTVMRFLFESEKFSRFGSLGNDHDLKRKTYSFKWLDVLSLFFAFLKFVWLWIMKETNSKHVFEI